MSECWIFNKADDYNCVASDNKAQPTQELPITFVPSRGPGAEQRDKWIFDIEDKDGVKSITFKNLATGWFAGLSGNAQEGAAVVETEKSYQWQMTGEQKSAQIFAVLPDTKAKLFWVVTTEGNVKSVALQPNPEGPEGLWSYAEFKTQTAADIVPKSPTNVVKALTAPQRPGQVFKNRASARVYICNDHWYSCAASWDGEPDGIVFPPVVTAAVPGISQVPGCVWIVTRVSGKNANVFTFQNFLTKKYAAADVDPIEGDVVVEADDEKFQWKVTTRPEFRGRYLITPMSNKKGELFWSQDALGDPETPSTITLQSDTGSSNVLWFFRAV